MSKKNLRLYSTLHAPSGKNPYLELYFAEESIPTPKSNEVVIRVEACPINPSDLISGGVYYSNLSNLKSSKDKNGHPVLRAEIDAKVLPDIKDRIGEKFKLGIEGAGTVVAAGSDSEAQKLLGKRVAVCPWEGMYSQYTAVDATQVLELLPGTTSQEGSSSFINPVTVLGFLDTMKNGGFKGIIHTAAASALGQMLVRVCEKDGIPLINIVRREEQVELLRKIGAQYVVNTSKKDWMNELTDLIEKTGIYLAFDAIGGGSLVDNILVAMNTAAQRDPKLKTKYGSTVPKQAYIYGLLDGSPTILSRKAGMWWSLGTWMLSPYLPNEGERNKKIRQRIAKEIKTTLQTNYVAELGLTDLTNADLLPKINSLKTAEKYFVNPQLLSGKQEKPRAKL